MSLRENDIDDFYLDRLGQSSHPSQGLWDRLNEPTIIITGLILAVTLLYNLYGSSAAFEEALSSLGLYLWDRVIRVLPSAPLFAVDNWLNPQGSSEQMVSSQPDLHASKTAAMRRILRLDRDRGLMASVFQARNRALSLTSSALGTKLDLERPAGLGNRDNSCFQNSILQGLAAVESLPRYLALCLNDSGEPADDADKVVTQTLRSLLSDLNDSSNNGKTLWTPNKLRFMSTWTQQDAQEYYSKILDDIDSRAAKAMEAAKRHTGFESDSGKDDSAASQVSEDSGYQSLSGSAKAADPTHFRNPLEGLLAQRVACVQCGYSEGLSMIPFNCLTISLGLRRQHDLYERLDAYSNLESIEGVECPKCTLLKAQRLLTKLTEQMREKGTAGEQQLAEPLRRLAAVESALEEDHFDDKTITETCKISSSGKVTTTKTKQIVVARPPQSLAIHVNRSVFDPSTFDMVKNSAPVAFPMTLDLGPWCLGSADGIVRTAGGSDGEGGDDGVCGVEHWLQDPRESMIAGDLRPSRLSGPIYELRAVVTHHGRHENGHYVCYRRFPRFAGPTPQQGDSLPSTDQGDVSDEVDDDTGEEDTITDAKAEDSNTGPAQEMDWWRLSDHNVSKVDAQTVAGLGSAVFMLFYDCIDSNMVVQDSSEVSRSASMSNPTSSPLDTSITTNTTSEAQTNSIMTPADAKAEAEQHRGDSVGVHASPAGIPAESVPIPTSAGDSEVTSREGQVEQGDEVKA